MTLPPAGLVLDYGTAKVRSIALTAEVVNLFSLLESHDYFAYAQHTTHSGTAVVSTMRRVDEERELGRWAQGSLFLCHPSIASLSFCRSSFTVSFKKKSHDD